MEDRYDELNLENLLAENDLERSGKISRFCLKQCLLTLGLKLEPFELLDIFDLVDTDGDFLVDYKELVNLIYIKPFIDIDALKQKLQNEVLEANFKSSCFDLRRIFPSSSWDREYVLKNEFREGIQKLRVGFNEDEISCLFEYLKNVHRDFVYIADICGFCDFDEEKYDAVAKKCYDRFLVLEREGIYIREEFRFHSKGSEYLSLEDFNRVVRFLGLPISKVELCLLLKRFLNPKHKSQINYRLFIDFISQRQRCYGDCDRDD
uniref:EF-hand domain-containing protein n=1 Tax=Aplanochytrium stocchinoi TaxID=215587 RepID=A0A7S3LI49_9STRA